MYKWYQILSEQLSLCLDISVNFLLQILDLISWKYLITVLSIKLKEMYEGLYSVCISNRKHRFKIFRKMFEKQSILLERQWKNQKNCSFKRNINVCVWLIHSKNSFCFFNFMFRLAANIELYLILCQQRWHDKIELFLLLMKKPSGMVANNSHW